MAVQVSYPGVYIQELPSGNNTIAGVATSITAFVGYLSRGPMNVPVQVLNFGDFQRAFGGLDELSELSYQINQFFLNGGSNAYVVRVPASAAPPTTAAAYLSTWFIPATPPKFTGPSVAKAQAGSLPTPLPSITGTPSQLRSAAAFQAANPGLWGGNLNLQVSYAQFPTPGGAVTGPPNTSPFNLQVLETTASGTVQSVVASTAYSGITLGSQATSLWADLAAASNPPLGIPPANWQTTIGTALNTSLLAPNGTVLVAGTPAVGAMPIGAPLFAFALGTPSSKTGGTPNWVVTTNYIAYPYAIESVSDFIQALQYTLAAAISQVTQAPYANAFSSAYVNTLYQDAAGNTYLQVGIADPNYAGFYLAVTVATTAAQAPTAFMATAMMNVQAYQLTAAFDENYSFVSAAGSPYVPINGGYPSGSDLAGQTLQADRQGIYAMEGVSIFNLLSLPDLRRSSMSAGDYLIAASNASAYCEDRLAFLLLDIPQTLTTVQAAKTWIANTASTFASSYAAAYFPELLIPDPLNGGQLRSIGVSGTMAGIYASTDVSRGVWKAPAGIGAPTAGVEQLVYAMTNAENGLLNPLGFNALRTFPVYGNVSWGARTLFGADQRESDYKYVPVRRLALYIEASLVQGLQWVVFEPNDSQLWSQIRLTVSSFMQQLFQQGAFAGSTPDTAYQVLCDASTTTQEDMENGIVNIVVMFAPVDPAEFVVITLQQMAGQSAS